MDEWRLGHTARTAAGEVRWDSLGDDSAPPVILLHGTPFSSVIWRGVARALARRHRVYVWDMPGYGTSARHDGQDISLAALARVFAELVEGWGLAEPLVVAHDSGGAVALATHLRHGVDYRRLALVDAVALPPWGSAFFEVVGNHADVFASLEPQMHRALLHEYVDSASSLGLHPATLSRLAAPWLDHDGQAAFYRQLAARRADPEFIDDLQPGYETVTMPVLLCWGAEDSWVPADRGRDLEARLPDARLEILPGAGHLVQEDRPAELTGALVDFLHEAPPDGRS